MKRIALVLLCLALALALSGCAVSGNLLRALYERAVTAAENAAETAAPTEESAPETEEEPEYPKPGRDIQLPIGP